MKRNWILVVLTVLTVTLSGCFGIEEKVLIHKDGSGVFTYSIDCTQMITQMMEMVAKLDKAFASDSTSTKKAKEKDPEDAKQKMMEKVKEDFIFNKDGKMSSVKGLSSYREFADTTGGKWVIGVTFNFDKVATLNKALATMFAKKEKGKSSKQGFPPPTYSFKNGVLTRELTQAQVQELAGGDDDEETTEAAKKLLKDFKYTIVVEADGEVKEATAPGAKLDHRFNKVTFDYDLLGSSKEIVQSKMKSEVKVY